MHFTVEAQELCRPWLRQGAIAVDATAGNGFDTVFLAQCVGSSGRVLAVDRQALAIARTRERVAALGLSERVECVEGDHAELGRLMSDRNLVNIDCAMFNLGYLPHGDKSIVTRPESTLRALKAVDLVLSDQGILSLLVYVGHDEEQEEKRVVQRWIEEQADRYEVRCWTDEGNFKSPTLWFLRKR
jgi:hypothetical protein